MRQAIHSPETKPTVRITDYERQQLEEFRHVMLLDRQWREGALETRPVSPAGAGRDSLSPWRHDQAAPAVSPGSPDESARQGAS